MSNILNQEEKNDLLNESGDNEQNPSSAGNVQRFDLTNQEKRIYSKIDELGALNEKFSNLIKRSFQQFLRKEIELSIQGIKISQFNEYINSLSFPSSINIVNISPLNQPSLFMLDSKLVFSLVDNYFGGKGGIREKNEIVDFTPTEIRIVRLLLDQLLADFKTAWLSIVNLDMQFKRMDLKPSQVKKYTTNENIIN